MGKTYVIGDIHGCYQSLVKLLAKLNPDPASDTIVVLGDFINRGPESAQVVTLLLKLKKEFRNFIALRGNHEQMFLDYLEGTNQGLFLQVGGTETIKSYGLLPGLDLRTDQPLPESHTSFLKELLFYWEDEQHIYVHAGLKPGVHLTQQSPDWLLWVRDQFISSQYDFGKTVIFGHTPFPVPHIESNKIGIDTGAVYGGSLTCLVLPDMKFVSVEGEAHWPPY